jgi:folate-binding protein YgfZ
MSAMGTVCQPQVVDWSAMFWSEYPRDVVRVAGADAATYLQSQVSQDLRGLAVGASALTFLLEPTGKVVVLARVRRAADDEFVLDTDAGFGELMVARLNRFRIRVKAEVESLDWRCVAVRPEGDEQSAADIAAVDGALPSWGEGIDLLAPAVEPPSCRAGTAADLLAARIDAAWPAMGSEIVPGETIPAETGVVSAAVSFTKGCYPGQELVERMDSRSASAPRHVERVDVAAGTVPGDPYLIDGEQAGVVTSVAGTAALALVRRSARRDAG